MLNADQVLHEAEGLPTAEKWRLVKLLLESLEQTQAPASEAEDWHQFLRETYGSLRETPIQRWDQGDYEDREPLNDPIILEISDPLTPQKNSRRV
jgi:hypothetical protein